MARVLSLLGAQLPKTLLPAAHDNTKGFWEAPSVVSLNDEILHALDSDWDDVFAFRSRKYLSNFDHFYLRRAVETLDQEFNGAEVIVLKDPRIAVLAKVWDRALTEAGYAIHYVVMVRNPLEVAESLRARNGFPLEKSLLLWSTYMLAADRDTRGHGRTFVAYDQLMNDWRAVRGRIEEGAGRPFRRDTAAASVDIDRFIDRGLRHHQVAANDLFSRADVPDEVKTLYRIMYEACDEADINSTVLDAIAADLAKLDQLVGPLIADLRASRRTLTEELSELRRARASERDHADTLEERLSAESSLRQAEAEAASRSNADYERRLAELNERLGMTEVERDRASAEAQQRTGEVAELAGRLAAAETERDRANAEAQHKTSEVAQLAERLSAAEIERDRARAKAQQKAGETAELTGRLAEVVTRLAEREAKLSSSQELVGRARAELKRVREDSRRDLDRVKAQFERDLQAEQQVRKNAEAARRASEGELARQYEDLARLTELLKKSEDEADFAKADAEALRKNSAATAQAAEEKLSQLFQETATLASLLRQKEQHSEQREKQLAWLVALNECLSTKPRWWNLLPLQWRQRWKHRHLELARLFDGDAYLRRHPDVAAAGLDPLDHYLRHGLKEGRPLSMDGVVTFPKMNSLSREIDETCEQFDPVWYAAEYPDVSILGMDPLQHFKWIGQKLGRRPVPKAAVGSTHRNESDRVAPPSIIGEGSPVRLLIDADWYRETYLAGSSEESPQEHFEAIGAALGYDPNEYFSVNWYLTKYPDVAAANVNPVEHYYRFGATEGRNPGPGFNTLFYAMQMDKTDCLSGDLFVHFLSYGRYEGRLPAPSAIQGERSNDALGTHLAIAPTNVTIGIVAYKQDIAELTDAVRSIDKAIARCGPNVASSIVIFDNGLTLTQCDLPAHVELRSNGKNGGFGRAHNEMMQRAFTSGANIYLGVNPDGALHHDCLKNLIRMSQRHGGSALIEALQFPEEHPKFYHPETLECEWISGACFLITEAIWKDTKGFDDNIFLYCEDVDLSWSARRFGYKTLTCPSALFYHDVTDRPYSPFVWREMLLAGRYLAHKWGSDSFRERMEKDLISARFFKSEKHMPALNEENILSGGTDHANFGKMFSFSTTRW